MKDSLCEGCPTRVVVEMVPPKTGAMGIRGAGSIGRKAEAVRQAINRSTKTLNACAIAEDHGKMRNGHVESILQRAEDNLFFLLDGLKRISVGYYDSFCELGMGLPGIVKIGLGWIESSSKSWLSTSVQATKNLALVDHIASLRNQLLTAEAEALEIYKGVKV